MKRVMQILLLLMVAGLLGGCAGSREYGPYSGIVIDKETNDPIPGAVIFVRFFTKTGHFAGTTSYFADAVEVLTNSQGEFTIPAQRLKSTELGHFWAEAGDVMIFKPGYGCYPGNPKSEAIPPTFPDKSYVVVKLPKLKTREERKENLGRIYYSRDVIPYEKQRHMLKLINIERTNLDLESSHSR
jgi:hypothetical protein